MRMHVMVCVVLCLLWGPILQTQAADTSTGVGVRVSPITDIKANLAQRGRPDLVKGLPLSNVGMMVVEVIDGKGFAKAGIKYGDVILRVGTKQTNDLESWNAWRATTEPNKTYPVLINRMQEAGASPTWKQQIIRVTIELEDKVPGVLTKEEAQKHLEAWTAWEKAQSQLPEDVRPYELKGDRLGMSLEMFKARYYREVSGGKVAPFCSDQQPNQPVLDLLHTATLAKAGIVSAATAYPFEANQPTIAGITPEIYVYHFVDAKLYDITVFINHDHFQKVVEAITAKYGPPTKEEINSYQNGFGAKFEGKVLRWVNKASTITLEEFSGKRTRSFLMFSHHDLLKKSLTRIKAVDPPRTDDL